MSTEDSVDMTLEQNVVKLMESSKSPQEWNANADTVKKANNGYPAFWFKAIVLSGVVGAAEFKWSL